MSRSTKCARARTVGRRKAGRVDSGHRVETAGARGRGTSLSHQGGQCGGLISGESAIIVFTISPPKVAELQAALVGENIVLTWTPAEGPFAIRHYALRYGGDWANGTAIAAPLST